MKALTSRPEKKPRKICKIGKARIMAFQFAALWANFIFMKGYDDVTDGDWVVLPRGDVAPHWSGLYVTLNRGGSLVLSRVTHERLGEPTGYLIMFDRFARRLALKPAVPGTRHAYPARNYGRRGSKIIRAYRLVTEFGVRPPDTIEFLRPKVDPDGNLILDLRKIRISPKAHSQCRTKVKSEKGDQKLKA